MKSLAWLIWMEASFQTWCRECQAHGITTNLSRITWYNQLYGPHLGDH